MSGKTMSAKILDGVALAKTIRAEVAAAVVKAAGSTRPGLASAAPSRIFALIVFPLIVQCPRLSSP